mmetsp:Transcript_19558/g.30642  ORF Transcript_19558/g.30642 Transcript_19558/m.30642 type:complete len:283 (-) Transcript_19558:45-893(-)
MPKLKPSGLSVEKDFQLLQKVMINEIRAYPWNSKAPLGNQVNIRYIIGIDEVANGSLAGPMVVAGCCALKPFDVSKSDTLHAVNDCKAIKNPKALSSINHSLETEPRILFDRLFMHSDEIDKQRNIRRSKLSSWIKCISKISYKLYATQLKRLTVDDVYDEQAIQEKGVMMDFDKFLDSVAVITDGQEVPTIPQRRYPKHIYSVPRADQMFFCVAAASILARHSVDELMTGKFHRKYVEYNFKKNKGYGTREHCEILRQIGPCPIHRRSFITNIWNSVAQKA